MTGGAARDHLRQEERVSVEGRTVCPPTTQNALEPVRPLVADGRFALIFVELAQPGPEGETIMIDSTHIKAHRTAASLSKRGAPPRAIGRTEGGLNSKLHMVCDALGRPLTFFLSPGQMGDAKGAVALPSDLPPARMLWADKGHDADWFREALKDKGITACISARRGRRKPANHNRTLYKQRHRSRTSSPVSRTGAASRPAATDAASSSSPSSASLQPSCYGCEA